MSVRGSDGGLPEYEPSSIPVYVGETVGDFCARLTGLPADDGGVEVLWGTILLPNVELLGALTTTKPWQIDFKGGKERLVLRVPQGLTPSREMMKYMKVREARAKGASRALEVKKHAEDGKKRRRSHLNASASNSALETSASTERLSTIPATEGRTNKGHENKKNADSKAVRSAGNRAGNAVNKKSGTDHNSDGRKRKEPNKRLQKEEPAEAERHHESPVIRVNILKPQIDERQRSTKGKKMRHLSEFYVESSSLVELGTHDIAERNLRVSDRYAAKSKRPARSSSPKIDEAEIIEQLTVLANSGPSLPRKKQKKRAARREAPSKPDTQWTSTDIPEHKVLEKQTPFSIENGAIGDMLHTFDIPAMEPIRDRDVRRTTFWCVYYMSLVSDALKSVRLLPPKYIKTMGFAQGSALPEVNPAT